MDISTEFLKSTFVFIGDNVTPINSAVNVFQDPIAMPTCHLHKQMLMRKESQTTRFRDPPRSVVIIPAQHITVVLFFVLINRDIVGKYQRKECT